MIRTLRPTDFGTFLALQRTSLPSLALTKTGADPVPPTLMTFVRSAMLMAPHYRSWIDVDDGRFGGLVSVRSRLGTDIWDIDQLVLPERGETGDSGLALLSRVCEAAPQDGIQRIFLRVSADSPVMGAARRAGFSHYCSEYVYRLPHAPKQAEWLPPPLRPRQRADHQALFQLYCACVPAGVRAVEGMTLQEWRWSDGWGFQAVGWAGGPLRNRRDFVLDGQGELTAWLRIDHRGRTLELLWLPDQERIVHDMVRFGALVLRDWRPIICSVRAYQTSLRFPLESLGFELLGEHALLARSLLARVSQPTLMPARA